MHLTPKVLDEKSWACTIGSGGDFGKVNLVPIRSINQPATAV